MSKQVTVGLLATLLLIAGDSISAQPSPKAPRIGFLLASSRDVNTTRIEAFVQGLRELGYDEKKNIVIDWRVADGKGAGGSGHSIDATY